MAARKKKTARKTIKKAATRKTAARKRRATGGAQHVGATDEQTVKAIIATAADAQ